jgi:hypothetical protein
MISIVVELLLLGTCMVLLAFGVRLVLRDPSKLERWTSLLAISIVLFVTSIAAVSRFSNAKEAVAWTLAGVCGSLLVVFGSLCRRRYLELVAGRIAETKRSHPDAVSKFQRRWWYRAVEKWTTKN